MLLSLFAVSAVGDGNMDVDTIQPESEMPGNQVTFTVTVYNNDVDETLNVDVTFDATGLSDEEEHTISAPEDVELLNIPKNSSRNQTFDIVVPGSLPEGDYTGYLTVTDKGNSNNTLTEQPFTLTILAKNDFSLSTNHEDLVLSPSTTEDFKVTITNTGSTDLTTFSAIYHDSENKWADNQHEDDDDEMLIFTYTFPETLVPGASGDLTVDVKAENNLDVDHYLGDITFTANDVEKQISTDVEVMPKICDEGVQGNLDIEIEEPDDGDEYKPGEKIDIEVQVDNDDDDNLDVVVEAILYNIDEDEEIEKVSEEKKIDDNDDEEFKLTLTIPTGDFDEDDTYYLYVRAYEEDNEDDHCNFAWIEIDIERDRDDVIVDKFTMTPEVASPGDTVFFSVRVENIGTDEQEDVYIE
ncbi:MAG: hypothetical protein U9Q69_04935, partial [Nanoarchaeota archaeon]|nr:hypothetical protein [Nanoarchaeota archaeon]